MNRHLHLMLVAVVGFTTGACVGGHVPNPAAPAPPVSAIPATVQAEAATTKTGGGLIPRSNAQGATVWHLGEGGELTFVLDGIAPALVSVSVRYSDDGGGDTVAILVDGAQVGSFKTVSTGSGGFGWNVFTVSPAIPLGTLSGRSTIAVRVLASDGYGVDFDALVFTAS